jgi:hypothetical protein
MARIAFAWMVLFTLSTAGGETILIGNLPGNDLSSTVDLQNNGRIKAMGFTTPAGGSLGLIEVQLRLDIVSTSSLGLVLRIFDNDTNDNPGTALATLAAPSITGTGAGTYSFTPVDPFFLQGQSVYWLVLHNTGSSRVDWLASNPALVPEGLGTHFGSRFSLTGAPAPPTGSSSILNSYAVIVPEPAGLGLAMVAGVALLRRRALPLRRR